MSEAKFTSGPWRVVATSDGFEYIASPESVEMVGHVPTYWKHTVCTDFKEADGNLIAAAPELYAALEKVVHDYDALGTYGEYAKRDALSALAKARGAA